MDTKLKKLLHTCIFNRNEPHVYIVSINNDSSIRAIYQAVDLEVQQQQQQQQLPLRYFEIKKLRNADKVVHYIYRTVNKQLETFDYTNI